MSMPTVTAMLMQKLQLSQEAAMMAQGASGAPPAQQAGAASGTSMDPGAEGPYSEDGSDGTAVSAGAPLPEQRPPRRDQSPI
jgi:hypothetical protein